MASAVTAPARASSQAQRSAQRGELLHRIFIGMGAATALTLIPALAAHGYRYYALPIEGRPFSPLHSQLRSSGSIGLKLGMLSVFLFVCLFLYPLRKRWLWLGRQGSTRRWLNFHVLLGLSTPFVVTFHSAFRFRGLAGLAYWTMISVALSGLIGRYLYAKIPRSMSAVRLTMSELEAQTSAAGGVQEFAELLRVPTSQEIRSMNIFGALWMMMRTDLARPILIGRLRRRELRGIERIVTIGGLRPSHNRDLESLLFGVAHQARLRTAMAFLDRTERVFHLWHVIHRPFSVSFVVLIAIHIGVALSVGF